MTEPENPLGGPFILGIVLILIGQAIVVFGMMGVYAIFPHFITQMKTDFFMRTIVLFPAFVGMGLIVVAFVVMILSAIKEEKNIKREDTLEA